MGHQNRNHLVGIVINIIFHQISSILVSFIHKFLFWSKVSGTTTNIVFRLQCRTISLAPYGIWCINIKLFHVIVLS